MYLGVPDDKGWTYQHEQGILQLEKDLGIEVKRIENIVTETARKAQENGQAQAVTSTKVDAIVESLARQEKIQEKTNEQIQALVQALLAK